MPKINKKVVDAAMPNGRDYVIWDSELPGFGLRVFASGKRSYVLQYRSLGRSRRYTIGLHGVWTPETARLEAKAQLGRIAKGDNPAEERMIDRQAITVKDLCQMYLADLDAGLVLGKGGRPKALGTVVTDIGRINRHIIPLLGNRRLKDLVKADVNRMMKDITLGKTRMSAKTKKLRGKSIVKGGAGTAARTVSLLGGMLTYAGEAGLIDSNPAHGIRKPKYAVRQRRLSEDEYRTLGQMLRVAAPSYPITANIIRLIAMTGCRRSEIINLLWKDVDVDHSCLRLSQSKEGFSVRPIGLPVVEFLETELSYADGSYVFPGLGYDNAFGGFPNQWDAIFKGSALDGVTAHVLRHSFASLANDLGYTEITIAALIGHSKGTMTSKYIHTLDITLVMAADSIAGYIHGLLTGEAFRHATFALDHAARKAALDQFLAQARQSPAARSNEQIAA
ncbi:MAG: site-specific integrase [Sphingorhabdus sp.]|uniref:tyrosine-type recombinase/integrase n=1 Tax=Sphingorhabdus sp. TaxID=1902408 RepID=UPI003CA5C4E9